VSSVVAGSIMCFFFVGGKALLWLYSKWHLANWEINDWLECRCHYGFTSSILINYSLSS
jgi:hypothetical protein